MPIGNLSPAEREVSKNFEIRYQNDFSQRIIPTVGRFEGKSIADVDRNVKSWYGFPSIATYLTTQCMQWPQRNAYEEKVEAGQEPGPVNYINQQAVADLMSDEKLAWLYVTHEYADVADRVTYAITQNPSWKDISKALGGSGEAVRPEDAGPLWDQLKAYKQAKGYSW